MILKNYVAKNIIENRIVAAKLISKLKVIKTANIQTDLTFRYVHLFIVHNESILIFNYKLV